MSPVALELEIITKQIIGTTTLDVLQLLNFVVGLLAPGEIYCEVGCFQGRSLIAALLNYPDQMAYAVDHFAEMNFQDQTPEKLANNLAEFNLSDQVFLCTQSFEEFFAELGTLETEDKIGVFFYDAAQDYQSQLSALVLVKPFLADQAVLVINGSNNEFVRQAIIDFLSATPEAKPLLDFQGFKHETYPFLDGVCVLGWDLQQIHPKDWLILQGKNSSTATIFKLRQAETSTKQEFLEQLLANARTLQEANENSAAVTKYQQYLLWQPENLSAWLNLGVLNLRQQNYLEAIEALTNAQKLDESDPLPYFNLGLAFEFCGDVAQAILAYQTAIACNPQLTEACNNLGALLLSHGELSKAETFFRQAISASPDDFAGHFNLGHALLAQTKIDEAIAAYKTAQQLQPDDLEIKAHLAKAISDQVNPIDLYLECGILAYKNANYPEAVSYLKNVLNLREGHSQTCNILAECYKQLHQEAEAISTLEHSLKLYPDVFNYVALFLLLRHCDHIEQATSLLKDALKIFPYSLSIHIAQSLLVPLFYATHAELLEHRQKFSEGLLLLLQELPNRIAAEKAIGKFDINLVLTVSEVNQFQIAYQGLNDLELQTQRGKFVQQLLKEDFPELMHPRSMPKIDGKIRVGYLSEAMAFGTLGELSIGWLRHHNHADFEIYCYYPGSTTADYLVQEFRQFSDYFYHIRDVRELCQQVLSDQLHILVLPNIGLDTIMVRLAGLRLAPIQCTSWCHPVTTGLSSIDYFLSCESMETSTAQSHYTEKLVCLPKIGIAFAKPVIPPVSKTRSDFGFLKEEIVYLSCQNTYKYQPQYDFIYPTIAQQVSQSKFVFLLHPTIGQKFQQRLQHAFSDCGLDSQDYCIFLPKMSEQDYFDLNQAANIFLDTFGWSGGITTMKAIACDLPIVTCPSEMMRGRHSYGILQTLGVTTTIAQNEQEYISIAVRLALDPNWRQSIIHQMQQQHDQLYDDKSCVLALENLFRQSVTSLT
ncbi:MAG: tetratricopeptide repeat protein [Aphanocapsa sp. GSE-SYN-MK-11-07L]|nr:tetratricopeptide repeat protein [Aphanocapsa sp. GSE-SYN-MK-11-07L]